MSYYKKSGAISSDDPKAIAKLEEKLAQLVASQEEMKKANAYYRKHSSMKGYPDMTDEKACEADQKIQKSCSWERQPYPGYHLQNNNANIRRIKGRIKELNSRDAMFSKDSGDAGNESTMSPTAGGWEFDGGSVVMNTDLNRIQILFDSKPDKETRTELKSRGFKWAPSKGAWQKQLNSNGLYAVKRIKCVQPAVESVV